MPLPTKAVVASALWLLLTATTMSSARFVFNGHHPAVDLEGITSASMARSAHKATAVTSSHAQDDKDDVRHVLVAGPQSKLTSAGLVARCGAVSLHAVPVSSLASTSPAGGTAPRVVAFVAALPHSSSVPSSCDAFLTSSATVARRVLVAEEKTEPSLLRPTVGKGQSDLAAVVDEQRRFGHFGTSQNDKKMKPKTVDEIKKEKKLSEAPGSLEPELATVQLLVFGHGRWYSLPSSATHALRRCRLSVIKAYDNVRNSHQGTPRNVSAISAALESERGAFVSVTATVKCVRAVAGIPAVRWVEPRPVVRLHNAVATKTMQAEVNIPTPPEGQTPAPGTLDPVNVGHFLWSAGLTGEGETLSVSDTGLDTYSCFFHDPTQEVAQWPKINAAHRKVLTYLPATSSGDAFDSQGHGTHVAGSAVGNSNMDHKNHDGMAKDAKVVFHDIIGTIGGALDVPGDMVLYFEQIQETGVKVSTSSWGGGYDHYTALDRRTDVAMARNPELLAFFSAGNEGTRSMGSPARAKNVVTVGATKNSFSIPERDTLASFSSRAPLKDGRIKPDFTAPGDGVVSARAGFSDVRHCATRYDRGTSMSTPLVAGAALLLRQHLRTGSVGAAVPKRARPLAATMKAYLLLGAHDMAGVAAATPNSDEGFGRIRLAPLVREDVILREGITEMPPLKTQQRYDMCFRVSKDALDTEPNTWLDTRAVLAWTDSASAPEGSEKSLVNDLDLAISDASGGTVFGNTKDAAGASFAALSVSSVPDRANNVERVTFPAPAAGETKDYWLTVYAHDVQDDTPFGAWAGIDGTYSSKGQPFSVAIGGASVVARDCATVLAENAGWKCPQNCNGRGACVAGKCQCNQHITGIACESCDADALCNGNGQCNPATKQCTCDATRFDTAADATCGKCAAGYYGPHCLQRCECETAGHGTCDKTTGACACESSAQAGHWGGPLCNRCADGWANAPLKFDGTVDTTKSQVPCTAKSYWCGTEGSPVDVVVTPADGPVLFQPFDNIATPTRMTCVWRFNTPPNAAASWLKLNLTHLSLTSNDRAKVWQGWGDPLDGVAGFKLEQSVSFQHRGTVEVNGNVGLIVRFDSGSRHLTRGFTGVVEAHVPPQCDTLCEGGCGNHGFCNCTGIAKCSCHASEQQGYWAGPNCDRCARDYAQWPVSATGENVTAGVAECATPAPWCYPFTVAKARSVVVPHSPAAPAFFQPGPTAAMYSQSCPWTIRTDPSDTVNTWVTLSITRVDIIDGDDTVKVYRGIIDPTEASEPPILTITGKSAVREVSGDGRVGLTVHYVATSYRRPAGPGFVVRAVAGPPPASCAEKCKDFCVRGTCSCPGPSMQPVCTCPADDVSGHWDGLTCGHCKTGYSWASLNLSTWALSVPKLPIAVAAAEPTCTTPAAWCKPNGELVEVSVASTADPMLLQVGTDVAYSASMKCQWRIRVATGETNGVVPMSLAIPHIDAHYGETVRVYAGKVDAFGSRTLPEPIATATGTTPLPPLVKYNAAQGFTVAFVSDGEANGRGFTAVAALREPPCPAFCSCHGHGACKCSGTGTDAVAGTCECMQDSTLGHWAGEKCTRCAKGWTSGTLVPNVSAPVGCTHTARYCVTGEAMPEVTVQVGTPAFLLATDEEKYMINMRCGWRLKAGPGAVKLKLSIPEMETDRQDKVRIIDGQPQSPFDVADDHSSIRVIVWGYTKVPGVVASDPNVGAVVTFKSDSFGGRKGFVVVVTAEAEEDSDSDDDATPAPGNEGTPAPTPAPPGPGRSSAAAVSAVLLAVTALAVTLPV